jgi:hypothetical protein
MQPVIPMRVAALLKTVTLLTIASCESQDRRLAEYAQRATDQQARQNERMAQQSEAVVKHSHEVTAAAHDLVEHDAAARRELIQAQDKFQQQTHIERVSLDSQRHQLDAERKAVVLATAREPVIAQAISTAGLLVAAVLPLLVTFYALRRLPERASVDLVSEKLLEELLVHPAIAQPSSATRNSLDGDRPSPLLGPANHPDNNSPPF